MHISLVAAFGVGNVIGNKGKIPWYLKEDLDYFKNLTKGSVVIMGRKTYESIGHPLSNRINVVMTRKPRNFKGVTEVKSRETALEVALKFSKEIFVIGGEHVYKEFMPLANYMYLTKINLETEGDAFFPEWDEREWEEISKTKGSDSTQNLNYYFLKYKRVN